jgi:hypothetical protein
MVWGVRIFIFVFWALLFGLTGWKDAHPDYIRLEVIVRVVATLGMSGLCLGLFEMGRRFK